jgi:hypothetical protein
MPAQQTFSGYNSLRNKALFDYNQRQIYAPKADVHEFITDGVSTDEYQYNRGVDD